MAQAGQQGPVQHQLQASGVLLQLPWRRRPVPRLVLHEGHGAAARIAPQLVDDAEEPFALQGVELGEVNYSRGLRVLRLTAVSPRMVSGSAAHRIRVATLSRAIAVSTVAQGPC